MRHSNPGRFRQQASFLRRQFLQDGDLPFTNVLTEESIAQALTTISICWLDRIFSPLVTLWVFLGQVLSADHSCRASVARLIAHRISRGNVRARCRRERTAKPENACQNSSFRTSHVRPAARSRHASIRSGFGKADVSTRSMVRRLPCRTRLKTSVHIRSLWHRDLI